jgi:hypothetical protein
VATSQGAVEGNAESTHICNTPHAPGSTRYKRGTGRGRDRERLSYVFRGVRGVETEEVVYVYVPTRNKFVSLSASPCASLVLARSGSFFFLLYLVVFARRQSAQTAFFFLFPYQKDQVGGE